MKKAIILLVGLMVLGACSSGPSTTTQRVDANTQVDLSGRWNDTDVRTVCDSLINSCLTSPNVTKQVNAYQEEHEGENPSVIVGSFRNTSSEHIDTSIITKMFQSAIINSGKLDFVASAEAREEIRDERTDQNSGNVSDDTAAAIGHEVGAKFMLQGSVKSIVDKAGNQSVRSYYVDAELIDIETNKIIWQDQNSEIKKVITQAKYKL